MRSWFSNKGRTETGGRKMEIGEWFEKKSYIFILCKSVNKTKIIMKSQKLLIIIISAFMIISCDEKEKKCIVHGKVINRDSKAIILKKAYKDTRTTDTTRIPISDSTFSFELNFKYPQAYALIFEEELKKGAWRPIYFFPVDGKIKMRLFDTDHFSKNQIDGSQLTTHYYNIQEKMENKLKKTSNYLRDSLSSLRKSNNYHSDTMKALEEKMRDIGYNNKDSRKVYNKMNQLRETGNAFTPTANQVRKQLNDNERKIIKELYDYMEQNPNIVSYYLLLDYLQRYESHKKVLDLNTMRNLQEIFAKKYEKHPYTKLTQELLWNIDNIKVGGKYYDFTLPDTSGEKHTLSELIKGRYALIDIWAPWCGPCISQSRSMIPVYKDFKDKGFTIVGIAGKYKNISRVKTLLKKDQYPWITLIDSNWTSEIWTKYGLIRSGGGIFFVNKKGEILAVNPSPDSVRDKLNDALD